MAKTIDDYDNFINLLSNPENFRVYSIDDSIKTTTNISIKLIAVIRGNESNNYELKFINKKREIPIGLRNYATDNPIYYNSNNLKCITSIHADDYEKNIYNIYHTTTTNLGEYIKYYIINNQEIIYEIKIYVPLIIIMNIINKQNTKIVLIDRTSKNFSETNETNKTQNCSIEIDLLKRISKKLFNIIDKYLKDTKFEGEIIKNLEEFNKITQLPSQSQESSSKVPAVQAAVPAVPAGKENNTQDGPKQQEVRDNESQTSSKRQQVEPSAEQSGLPSAEQSGLPSAPQFGSPFAPQSGLPSAPQSGLPSAPQFGSPFAPQFGSPFAPQSGLPVAPVAPARPVPLGQVVPRPQGSQGPSIPTVVETTRVINTKDYVEFCGIEVLKNINITTESIIKENDDFYKSNGIVIVAPIDKYNNSLIKEIYKKFKLTFNEQEITNNRIECDAMFKKYDEINIINLINPNLEPYNQYNNSSNTEKNLKKLEELITTSYINILKELIKNINENSNIKELRIPINYNRKSAGNFYDVFKSSNSGHNNIITIPTYSFYALYNALNSLTQDEINLLTRHEKVKISIHLFSDEKDYNYNEVIKVLEDLKIRHILNYKDQCDLKQQKLRKTRQQLKR